VRFQPRERLGGRLQHVDQQRRRDEQEVPRRKAFEGEVQVSRCHVLRRGWSCQVPAEAAPDRRHPQR
jgi:hypothetical protein